MATVEIGKIRNAALLSHSGAGKTSLAEALLFNTKAINRMGNVESGNTVSDYEAEEVKRASSVQASIIPCMTKGHKVNFLDTPGYDDFPRRGGLEPTGCGRSGYPGERHRRRGGGDGDLVEHVRGAQSAADYLHQQDGQGQRRVSAVSGQHTVGVREAVRAV